MQIVELEKANITTPTALALGYFDTFHRGHQALLNKVLSSDYAPAMFTFTGDYYGAIGSKALPVFSEAERMEIAEKCGIQYVFTLPADREHFDISAGAFLRLLLNVRPALIVCGEDFRFGRDATAGVLTLADFCRTNRIQFKLVHLMYDRWGSKIGTDRVREAIAEGDMSKARILLGRDYTIQGVVSHGRGDGRLLGFPTANIALDPSLQALAFGVYAAYCRIEDAAYAAVVNVGPHPTMGDMHANVEAHLCGFAGDLYGQTIVLHIVERLRDIQQFDDTEALQKQIASDVVQTKRLVRRKIR